MPRLDLTGAVAVVTGAASGIGRATALAFARRGCHLALVDLDGRGLERTTRAAGACAVGISTHVLDVKDAEVVSALPERVLAEHGRATVLVNSAGVALVGRVDEVAMDELRWLFDINFFAVAGLTKAFLPHLRAERAAQIVNVSSLFGLVAPAEQAAYAASKFAVRGYSEALRHELHGTTVGVTVVHPGGVRTAISRNARIAASADARAAARMNRAFERTFLRTPPERVGEAIARAVERRRSRLLVATGARSGDFLQRLLPASYWRLLRLGYSRLRR